MRKSSRANSVFCAPCNRYGRIWRLFQYSFIALLALSCKTYAAEQLAPFKDRLFTSPATLEERDSGGWRKVDYREVRDINRRDAVPERRVRNAYIDRSVNDSLRDLSYGTSRGVIRFSTVGRADSAGIITVFIHGRGGDRTLGMNDFRFGGNFNRIKNLMVRNNGLYLVPDAGDFSDEEIVKIRELLIGHLEFNQSAKLFLACGSAGGMVCHELANDRQIIQRTVGIGFLGSFADSGYVTSFAGRRQIPVYIAHGSADSIFNVSTLESFYTELRDQQIPVRMVRFETGGHGTPIRMLDWRAMLNWALSEN
ncbi:MAG: alpha/beta hydrolase [Pseudomonadota bacterium]